jgi:hypothetical protein
VERVLVTLRHVNLVKQTMVAPIRAEIVAAVEREKAWFVELVGAAANADALAAFADRK